MTWLDSNETDNWIDSLIPLLLLLLFCEGAGEAVRHRRRPGTWRAVRFADAKAVRHHLHQRILLSLQLFGTGWTCRRKLLTTGYFHFAFWPIPPLFLEESDTNTFNSHLIPWRQRQNQLNLTVVLIVLRKSFQLMLSSVKLIWQFESPGTEDDAIAPYELPGRDIFQHNCAIRSAL